jgi:hypothetical protein
VSGTRGATIYYEHCNFPNMDVLSCFYVSYPAAEKAKWDAIVTRIGQSLRFALRGSPIAGAASARRALPALKALLDRC